MENLTREVVSLRADVHALTEALKVRSRRLRNVLICGGLMLLVVAGVAWKAIDASSDAKNAVHGVENVVAENQRILDNAEADRVTVALLACQNRNSGQRSVREAFELALGILVNAQSQPPTQGLLDVVASINAGLAKTPDRDCNDDDAVDESDYLDETSG